MDTESKLCSTQQSLALCLIIKVSALFTCLRLCLLLCKQASPCLCKMENVTEEYLSILTWGLMEINYHSNIRKNYTSLFLIELRQ